MLPEGSPSVAGDHVSCVGFAPDELFYYLNHVAFFQRSKVACQISVGNIKEFFEGIEIYRLIHHEYRHDPKSYATFKLFV
jgi:hypothetical protein